MRTDKYTFLDVMEDFVSSYLPLEKGCSSKMLDGELRETQTADYFSGLCPIDCAVLSVNA